MLGGLKIEWEPHKKKFLENRVKTTGQPILFKFSRLLFGRDTDNIKIPVKVSFNNTLFTMTQDVTL